MSVLKAASSTPNIPATATISAVDRAVLEKMSNGGGGSPDRFDLGSSADSLKLKRILHGQASSSASSSSESDEFSDSSAKSRVSVQAGPAGLCNGNSSFLQNVLHIFLHFLHFVSKRATKPQFPVFNPFGPSCDYVLCRAHL